MTLEQAFECPRTLSKLRRGPLGALLDGFCDSLLECGFSRGTVRKHLVNVSHLNAYLVTRKGATGVRRANTRDGRALLFNLRQEHGACGATLDAGGFTHFLSFLFAAGIHTTAVRPGGTDLTLL